MIPPIIPDMIPAGCSGVIPNMYVTAPPAYDPATPNAMVFQKPKFSSPG